MRILVAGATGYIGSRLVPELLRRGHEVVAASSSAARTRTGSPGATPSTSSGWTPPTPRRCAGGHGGRRRGLLPGARAVAAAASATGTGSPPSTCATPSTPSGVGRVVYLSGLVPDVPEDELSPHIASRLEVERILLGSTAATLSLRAGVVIGAGSTSFEIVRQTASTLLVQPVPLWMRSRVQPIGVADVLRAIADALEGDAVGDVDVGGPDVMSYPDAAGAVRRGGAPAPRPGPRCSRPGHGGVAGGRAGLRGAVLDGGGPGAQPAARHGLPARPAGPGQGRPHRRAAAARGAGRGGARRRSRRSRLRPRAQRPGLGAVVVGRAALVATRLPGTTLLSSALHVADHRLRGLRAFLPGPPHR